MREIVKPTSLNGSAFLGDALRRDLRILLGNRRDTTRGNTLVLGAPGFKHLMWGGAD